MASTAYGPMKPKVVAAMTSAAGYTPVVIWQTEVGWFFAYVPEGAEEFWKAKCADPEVWGAGLMPPKLSQEVAA